MLRLSRLQRASRPWAERWFGLRRRPSPGQWIALGGLLLVLIRQLTAPAPIPPLPVEGTPTKVARAVDGDTLLLATGQRVRLLGVNTPESKHPRQPVERWGSAAAEFLQSQVAGRSVILEYDRQRQDVYGRVLAYVFVNGRLLNTEIIRAGWSRAQTQFPFRADRRREFLAAEAEAREARRGLWVDAAESGR